MKTVRIIAINGERKFVEDKYLQGNLAEHVRTLQEIIGGQFRADISIGVMSLYTMKDPKNAAGQFGIKVIDQNQKDGVIIFQGNGVLLRFDEKGDAIDNDIELIDAANLVEFV